MVSTEHSAFNAQYAALNAQYSALSSQWSVLSIQYSMLITQHWESRDSVFDFSFLSVLLMIGRNFWILLSVVTFKRKSCEAVAHAASLAVHALYYA